MQQFLIQVTDDEFKALAWDTASPFEWVDNLVHNKTRQCLDAICIMAFSDETNTIISAPDKNKIQAFLHAEGFNILRIENWPKAVKEAAVNFAKIKSAAERVADAEAEHA